MGQIRKSYGRGEQREERKRTARGESAAHGEHAAPGGSFRTQPTWPTWPTSLLMTHQLPHHPPRRSCEAAAHHVGANVAIRRITCLCDAREGATVRACVREREREEDSSWVLWLHHAPLSPRIAQPFRLHRARPHGRGHDTWRPEPGSEFSPGSGFQGAHPTTHKGEGQPTLHQHPSPIAHPSVGARCARGAVRATTRGSTRTATLPTPPPPA